ncbi:MAG: aminotransferase class V-fold PLP-dependent enzyme [Chloroflexi bacterium]|nr:aminotransferase class V-fold PLP-dependent enzyme [Chloroflexota bacterium]
MRVIDLRSDTVTQPTSGMRRAMAEARVGDDVLGDDPTVKELERASAGLLGKEAALYVPSGTMANLLALLLACDRGEQAVVGSESHILHHEGLGAPALGGVHLAVIPNDARGRLPLEALDRALEAGPALVCLENTHNRCGGAAVSLSHTREVAERAHAAGAAVHVDGARIFNAALARESDAASLVADADTASFCFSKGLGAPVGSVLCGSSELIARARPLRRQLGGGMRQAGVIAAAALHALENHVERLAEDHAHARLLAEGLSRLPGIRIDPQAVETNLVFFELDGPEPRAFREALTAAGVLASGPTARRVRMATHLGISAADVEEALARTRRVVESLPEPAAR